MVKFGIISDTHVVDTQDSLELSRLYERIKEIFRDVDEIIHAGDVCTKFFLEKLQHFKPLKAVSGNMDKIGNLKKFIKFNVSRYKIGVIHVAPDDIQKFSEECDINILIHGHTHQPLIQGTDYNILILNPGSPTKPRTPPKKSGFKEPIPRKTVMTLEINDQNGMIITYIINI